MIDPLDPRMLRRPPRFEKIERTFTDKLVAQWPGFAGLLDVPARTPAARVRRRWTADGAPAMVAEDILLLPPGEGQVPEEPLFHAAATLWGEPVVWEITTPSAAAADGDLATLLGLPEQSPLMVFETVGMLAGGRRIFYALEHHKSDLVQYSVVRTVRPPWTTT